MATRLADLCRCAVRAPLTWLEAFLGSPGADPFAPLRGLPVASRRPGAADLPAAPAYPLRPGSSSAGRAGPPCVPPSLVTVSRWYRNVDRLPIAYALRPRLRSRLTLSGRTLLRNPQAFGGPDSHRPGRYLCRHSPFRRLHPGLRSGFAAGGMLPYHRPSGRSGASAAGLVPVALSAQDRSTSELLRTLSMMAASKPTSWLSGRPHILGHSARTWGP